MIIGVLLGLFVVMFGGGEKMVYDISEPVTQYVQDEAKAEQILAINKAMLKEADLFTEDVSGARKSLEKLNGNRSTSGDELQAVFTALALQRAEGHKRMLDGRFQMKELMTEEEWNNVFTDQPEE